MSAFLPARPVSRYPVPALDTLPEDIRARILEVQDKAGFVPNIFVALAHRPDEFRAFFAYHIRQYHGGHRRERAYLDFGLAEPSSASGNNDIGKCYKLAPATQRCAVYQCHYGF